MKDILQNYNLKELSAIVEEMGERPFRAKQLYDGMMRGHDISDIPALPSAFVARLTERFEDCALKIVKTLTSADGTEKYLFRLADGNIIEGVFMKYKYGNTQCVSTQVGCRMGCRFCASTLGGLVRDLSSGEILSQVLKVNAAHGGTPAKRQVTNVVLMGSGEPLDNYGNVVKFVRDMAAEGGINISPRNVSLSTCGLVPEMYALANEGLPLNLTVSLHNVSDEERARTMPVAKRYKIADILAACSDYFDKTGRRYIFEYSLIDGENADEAHAKALAALLRGRPCHVNLIRLNDVKERSLSAASEAAARKFLKLLTEGGISATLRRRMGADIGGACGQLRAGYIGGSAPQGQD